MRWDDSKLLSETSDAPIRNLKRMLTSLLRLLELIKTFLKSISLIVQSIYCYKSIKPYLCNHLNVGIWYLYKRRVQLPHPVGIVIGYKVRLGYDCTVYQNVTIGAKSNEDAANLKYPILGNNVTIYANSVIIGDLKIGDNAIIGAGTVVLDSFPEDSIAAGNPGRIISYRKDNNE